MMLVNRNSSLLFGLLPFTVLCMTLPSYHAFKTYFFANCNANCLIMSADFCQESYKQNSQVTSAAQPAVIIVTQEEQPPIYILHSYVRAFSLLTLIAFIQGVKLT